MEITTLGAFIALGVAIFLIIKGIPAVYGMIIGALLGGITSGLNIFETVNIMINGASGMSSALLRIITAGVLAGVLMESGAAGKIAETIVKILGDKKSLVALTISTFILTGIGVFGDVAALTVAPIGLQIGKKTNFSKLCILFAIIGGVKAGNLVSPNPNTIAAAEALHVPLTSLMLAGYLPAIFGIISTCLLTITLKTKGSKIENEDLIEIDGDMPTIFSSLIGPFITIFLLILRPLFNINIDPLVALPVGGIVGCIFMKKTKNLLKFSINGLNKMSGVVLLLIGTGTLAGIISNSTLKDLIIAIVDNIGLPGYLLAPIAGITMGAATASAIAGASVGGNVFGPAILSFGVQPLQAAAMIYAGTLWFDSLPHGSFFHVSGGAVSMKLPERMKLLPYELCIGIIMTIVATFCYGILGINF